MFKLSDTDSLFMRIMVYSDTPECIEATNSLHQDMGDDALLALSERNDVASLVAHALLQSGDKNLAACWKEVHTATLNRISAYLSELDHIADRLAERGIPLVALKNGGIARGIYPCLGCSPMGDIDVLVENRHFRKAHEILLESGYHFQFRNPMEEADLETAEEDGGAEYWKVLSGGEKLWLELQWRPVAGRWLRPDQEPSAKELMARSIDIAGSAVRLLSPEDNLLQVALHTAKHTYVRAPGFRLHLDVVRIVQAYPELDWQIFVTRVLSLQIKAAVYFSLAIPNALFAAAIPDWVLDRLRPSLWKEKMIVNWLQRVGLFNPREKKFSKPGYILFNMLLYDDLKGLLHAIFPNRAFMQARYGADSSGCILLAHLRRLFNLTFSRTNT